MGDISLGLKVVARDDWLSMRRRLAELELPEGATESVLGFPAGAEGNLVGGTIRALNTVHYVTIVEFTLDTQVRNTGG